MGHRKEARKPPKIVRSEMKNDEIKLDFIEDDNDKKAAKKAKKKKKRDYAKETDHECVGKHLFVLVHGYQGNSWDMRMFRNHLLVKCPNDLFLMSESNENEGNTEGDITEMGQRLCQEIIEFIELNIISQKHKLCRL